MEWLSILDVIEKTTVLVTDADLGLRQLQGCRFDGEIGDALPSRKPATT